MDTLFFKAALVAYLAATVGYLVSLVVRRVVLAKVATWILGLAVALHTVHFLFVFQERGVNIAVNLFEAMSFFAWIVSGAYLALQLRTHTRVLGAIVSPFAVLLMMLSSLGLEGTLAIPDSLQGRLVPIHVTLCIIGEGLFALASLAGIMYCIQDRQIRQRKMGGLARYLPSLGDLDNINHAGLLWGFPILTLGLIVGSFWARTAWGGSNWPTDPKTVWSFVVWLFYAFLLHQRLAIGWKGRKIAVLSIVALAVMISAFIGVSFLSSVHRVHLADIKTVASRHCPARVPGHGARENRKSGRSEERMNLKKAFNRT